MTIEFVSFFLIAIGLVFFFGASVGLLRFPDFFARMHAAGKIDTLANLLVILGLAVYQLKSFHGPADWEVLAVMLKMLGISAFIMLTGPTSTHALMDAGFEDGTLPVAYREEDALAEDNQRRLTQSGD